MLGGARSQRAKGWGQRASTSGTVLTLARRRTTSSEGGGEGLGGRNTWRGASGAEEDKPRARGL